MRQSPGTLFSGRAAVVAAAGDSRHKNNKVSNFIFGGSQNYAQRKKARLEVDWELKLQFRNRAQEAKDYATRDKIQPLIQSYSPSFTVGFSCGAGDHFTGRGHDLANDVAGDGGGNRSHAAVNKDVDCQDGEGPDGFPGPGNREPEQRDMEAFNSEIGLTDCRSPSERRRSDREQS